MKHRNSLSLRDLSPERPIKNRSMKRLVALLLCGNVGLLSAAEPGYYPAPAASGPGDGAPLSAGASQTGAVTNDSVLKLVKAGIPDEVILNMVASQPGQYTVTADALISLKLAGVSDKVMAAMVSHSNAPSVAQSLNVEPLVLHDGTPVRLRLSRNLSSADATTGETVDFEVLDDVKVDDQVVIAHGAKAIGTVTDAEHKKHMGRGGKLDLTIDFVRLVNDEKAALRGVKETKGGGHTGAMTGAMVATAVVVWPAAPLFLFMHGKDTTIPKGTEITAYTDGELKLDRKKIAAKQSLTS